MHESTANLIIIAVTPDEEQIQKLRNIVIATKQGVLISITDFSFIEDGLLQVAAYIAQDKEILV